LLVLLMKRYLCEALVPEDRWARSCMCGACGARFSDAKRRHHCRYCGQSICSACSHRVYPSVNDDTKPVRACPTCHSQAEDEFFAECGDAWQRVSFSSLTNATDRLVEAWEVLPAVGHEPIAQEAEVDAMCVAEAHARMALSDNALTALASVASFGGARVRIATAEEDARGGLERAALAHLEGTAAAARTERWLLQRDLAALAAVETDETTCRAAVAAVAVANGDAVRAAEHNARLACARAVLEREAVQALDGIGRVAAEGWDTLSAQQRTECNAVRAHLQAMAVLFDRCHGDEALQRAELGREELALRHRLAGRGAALVHMMTQRLMVTQRLEVQNEAAARTRIEAEEAAAAIEHIAAAWRHIERRLFIARLAQRSAAFVRDETAAQRAREERQRQINTDAAMAQRLWRAEAGAPDDGMRACACLGASIGRHRPACPFAPH
jgi:hypothetical protein